MWNTKVLALLRLAAQFPILCRNGIAIPSKLFMFYNVCLLSLMIGMIFLMEPPNAIMRNAVLAIAFYVISVAAGFVAFTNVLNPVFRSKRICAVFNEIDEIDRKLGNFPAKSLCTQSACTLKLAALHVIYWIFAFTTESLFPSWSAGQSHGHIIYEMFHLFNSGFYLNLGYIMNILVKQMRRLNENLRQILEGSRDLRKMKVSFFIPAG